MGNKEKGCNLFFIYHCRYYIKNLKSSIFNILSIAIGIAIFMVIQMIVLASENEINTAAKAKVGGDIGIVLDGNLIGDDLADKLEQEKKIVYTKSIWDQGTISSGNRNSLCVIRYVNPEEYPYYKQSGDTFDYKKLNDLNCIAVSEKLANSLNVKVGESVKLQSVDSNSSDTFKIIAVVPDDGEDALDMNIYGYVFISENKLFENISIGNSNIASKIYIKCEEADTDNIIDIFRDENIQLVESEVKNLEEELNGSKIIYNSMGILSVLMAFVGIISSVFLQAIKRQKEICILKLYGATDFNMAFNFLKEFMLLVFLGMIAGLGLGLFLSHIVCGLMFGYNLNNIDLLAIIQMFFKILILGIVTGMIFGVIPIILTLQFKPIDILREKAKKQSGYKKLIFVCLLIGINIFAIAFSVFIHSRKGFILVYIFSVLIGVLFILSIVLLRLFTFVRFSSSIKSIALKSLKKDCKKFSFIVLVVSLCVAVIGMILLMYNSILPSLEAKVENSLGYNALFKINAKEENFVNNLLVDSNVEGYFVSTIVDFSLIEVNGKSIDQSEAITYSIDCIHNDMGYVNDNIIYGAGLNISDSNEIVLDEDFSIEYQINTGDTVTLLIEGQQCDFNVIGIRSTDKVKTGHAYVNFNSVSKYTNSEVLRYYIITKDTEAFIKFINSNFDDVVVLNIEDISAPYAATINKQMKTLKIVSLLSMITAAFLIFNILSITYIGKQKEFMVLGLYGADKNIKRKIIIMQGIRIGSTSSLVAFFISIIGALIMEMLIGIGINYDLVSFIEVVFLSIFISLLSVMLVSIDIVNCKKYDLLRIE